MKSMSPYYAHESGAGDVFDVAHYSPAKSIFTGVIAVGFAAAIAVVAVYVWEPTWLVSEPSEIWADAQQEIVDLKQQHSRAVMIGVAVAGLFALLCLAGGLSLFANAASGDFYLRAGEHGLSIRAPQVLSGALVRDIAWEEIENLTVVQVKRLGAMSRGAGNLGGELKIRTFDGETIATSLDQFREDAWLIYDRIEEAREMRAALCPQGEEAQPQLA